KVACPFERALPDPTRRRAIQAPMARRGSVKTAVSTVSLVVALAAIVAESRPPPAGSPRTPALDAVAFVDARHGWIGGNGIYGTDDGGRTWRREGSAGSVLGIAAVDASHAWAASATGLLRTVDGRTWRRVSPQRFYTLSFATTAVGLAVVGVGGGVYPRGPVLLSRDGGHSWRAVGLRGHSVCAASPRALWIGDGGTLLLSRDAGHNWHAITHFARYVKEVPGG